MYSRSKLTKPGDTLIALSGIAKMMYEQLRVQNDVYLAGLWKNHMASQLLWRLEPVFENGEFKYPSERVTEYRAPTWSWAAVDADQGVIYGDIIEDGNPGLRISVEDPEVHLAAEDPFGLVDKGSLHLTGVLKKIEMRMVNRGGKRRYVLNLVSRYNPRAREHKHSNVCLDSPFTDNEEILGNDVRLYCVPAWKDPNGSLVCLILQQLNKPLKTYRRVGVTKISNYEKGANEVYELSGDVAGVPDANWVSKTGKHRVCVI